MYVQARLAQILPSPSQMQTAEKEVMEKVAGGEEAMTKVWGIKAPQSTASGSGRLLIRFLKSSKQEKRTALVREERRMVTVSPVVISVNMLVSKN